MQACIFLLVIQQPGCLVLDGRYCRIAKQAGRKGLAKQITPPVLVLLFPIERKEGVKNNRKGRKEKRGEEEKGR